MTPKEIRQWVQERAHPCPCCGAAVVVSFDTTEEGQVLLRRLAEIGYERRLVSAEEAEAELREMADRAERVGLAAGGWRR